MKATQTNGAKKHEARQGWQKPVIRKVGAVSDVIKGGGGKLSVTGGDPGDGRKPTGGE